MLFEEVTSTGPQFFALAPLIVFFPVIGLLITLLFLGLVFGWHVTIVCTLLFVAALLCVVLAMFAFVRELSESLVALELSIEPRAG